MGGRRGSVPSVVVACAGWWGKSSWPRVDLWVTEVSLVTSSPVLSKAGNYISQKPSGLNSAGLKFATERNLWKIWKEEGKQKPLSLTLHSSLSYRILDPSTNFHFVVHRISSFLQAGVLFLQFPSLSLQRLWSPVSYHIQINSNSHIRSYKDSYIKSFLFLILVDNLFLTQPRWGRQFQREDETWTGFWKLNRKWSGKQAIEIVPIEGKSMGIGCKLIILSP